MRNRLLPKLAAALFFAAGLAPAAQATAIVIDNASFEANVLAENANTATASSSG